MRFVVLGLIIPCGIRVSGHVAQPFTWNTSPEIIDRKDLETRRTGARQIMRTLTFVLYLKRQTLHNCSEYFNASQLPKNLSN